MEAHVWKLDYKTGNEIIDREHAILLGMFNSMKQAIISREKVDFILYIFRQLMDYAQEHVIHEEQLMAKCGYPDLEAHMRAHLGLKEEISKLKAVIEQGNIDREAALFHLHHEVYQKHLLVHDKKFGEFLKNSSGEFSESSKCPASQL